MKKLSLILVLSATVACDEVEEQPPELKPPVIEDSEATTLAGCTVTTISTLQGGNEESLKEYDEDGRIVRSYFDTTNDFMPADDREYFYNQAGQLILETGQDEWEGRIWETHHIYDDRGLRIRSESNHGFRERVTTMTYSDAGLLLVKAYDYDGDGEFDQEVSYVYNEAGQWIEETWTHTLNDRVQQISHRNYDAQGRLIHFFVDYQGDGVINSQVFYTHSILGLVTTERRDFDGDDSIEYAVRYLYRTDGQLLRSASYYGDFEDNSPLYTQEYTYNDVGWLLDVVRVPQSEAVPEAYSTTEYDCES